MSNATRQTVSTDQTWGPETANGKLIEADDRLWWADLNGVHAPRWVTVVHFDDDEGLIICRDATNQHYMTVLEELTQ